MTMEVRFQGVTKLYQATPAVKSLDLTIKRGALHFILGPSGCGKTTTLRMLAGLEQPTAGQIFFDARDVTNMPADQRGIGMVFQNYALWPHMTVRENIAYGLKLRKLKGNELEQRLSEVLGITQLTRFASRLPGQLSGGQQQRVALARALAIRPSVLLLDEPLSNLDAKLRLEMRDNIASIHSQTGITTVYVTHDQKEALSMATEVSVMHSGRLIQSGAPRELYNAPNSVFISGFIGETNIITGSYQGRDGDLYRIESDIGTLHAARASHDFVLGAKVELSVRPEDIRIGASNGGARAPMNAMRLVLKRLTYLGDSEQLVLGMPDEKACLKATIFGGSSESRRLGEAVDCQIAPERLIAFMPDENLGPAT